MFCSFALLTTRLGDAVTCGVLESRDGWRSRTSLTIGVKSTRGYWLSSYSREGEPHFHSRCSISQHAVLEKKCTCSFLARPPAAWGGQLGVCVPYSSPVSCCNLPLFILVRQRLEWHSRGASARNFSVTGGSSWASSFAHSTLHRTQTALRPRKKAISQFFRVPSLGSGVTPIALFSFWSRQPAGVVGKWGNVRESGRHGQQPVLTGHAGSQAQWNALRRTGYASPCALCWRACPLKESLLVAREQRFSRSRAALRNDGKSWRQRSGRGTRTWSLS